MSVNRQNYETFFLLYVDRELNEAGQREVELFVQQHPDLAPELEMLRAAILETETAQPVVFPGKESLFRSATREEDLLLYIDGELDLAATAALETEIAASATLQQELQLLQQAVLPVVPLVFEQKELLYRHEERRVIPFAWRRLAIAAAFIGIAVTGWWVFGGHTSPAVHEPLAIHEPRQTVPVIPATAPPALPGSQDTTSAATTLLAATLPAQQHQQAPTATTIVQAGQQPVATPVSTQPGRTENEAVTIAVATVNQPSLLASASAHTILPAATPTVASPAGGLPSPLATAADAALPTDKQTVATSDIVYKELDTSDETEYLYVGSLEINKNKLTGLLKRAGHLIGGKAKNPDHL